MRENPIKRDTRSANKPNRPRTKRPTGYREVSQVRSRRKKVSGGPITAALCILLPPLGVALMWARGNFSRGTRIALSVLGAALLFIGAYSYFYSNKPDANLVTFSPSLDSVYAPVSVTAEPTAEPGPTQVPYELVVAPTATPDPNAQPTGVTLVFVPIDPSATPQPTDAGVTIPDNIPEGQAVFTAEGSLYYHASSNCQGHTYNVVLSLDEARGKGLAPCNNCHPAQ